MHNMDQSNECGEGKQLSESLKGPQKDCETGIDRVCTGMCVSERRRWGATSYQEMMYGNTSFPSPEGLEKTSFKNKCFK